MTFHSRHSEICVLIIMKSLPVHYVITEVMSRENHSRRGYYSKNEKVKIIDKKPLDD